jgi:FMN phosphatase YigB (HAD superfamily)
VLVAHFADERSWLVFPEVRSVLGTLRDSGLKLAVVSNWDSTLPSLLSRLGLAVYFDTVVVSALVGCSKPSRAIFEEALHRMNVLPKEALHVGDNVQEDYFGALGAGLDALLVDRSGRVAEGVATVRSLAEIPRRIGKDRA